MIVTPVSAGGQNAAYRLTWVLFSCHSERSEESAQIPAPNTKKQQRTHLLSFRPSDVAQQQSEWRNPSTPRQKTTRLDNTPITP